MKINFKLICNKQFLILKKEYKFAKKKITIMSAHHNEENSAYAPTVFAILLGAFILVVLAIVYLFRQNLVDVPQI